MFTTSEEAMSADVTVSIDVARRELANHHCRIIRTQENANGFRSLLVTNDLDEPEWIDCSTKAILEYLGY